MVNSHFSTDCKHFGVYANIKLSQLLAHTSLQLCIAFIGHQLVAAILWFLHLGTSSLLHVYQRYWLRICNGISIVKHAVCQFLCALHVSHQEATVFLAPPTFSILCKFLGCVHLLLT